MIILYYRCRSGKRIFAIQNCCHWEVGISKSKFEMLSKLSPWKNLNMPSSSNMGWTNDIDFLDMMKIQSWILSVTCLWNCEVYVPEFSSLFVPDCRTRHYSIVTVVTLFEIVRSYHGNNARAMHNIVNKCIWNDRKKIKWEFKLHFQFTLFVPLWLITVVANGSNL